VSFFINDDWAVLLTDKRSTSGYYTYVWRNLMTWRRKKQEVVAKSNVEAKFRDMTQEICE
jgi:hypothetical protein